MKHVVVIAGPSGSGKNAVIEHIMQDYPRCVRLVTATTRAKRPGEKDGVDYHFLTKKAFEDGLTSGLIPEHRYVPALDTYYGIYLPDLEERIKEGKTVFAQVDIEGARLLKERYAATTIFIMPESLDQFRRRLEMRNPEWKENEFEARMKIADEELRTHAPQYDHRVVNADGKLEQTAHEVVEILRKEGYNL